MSRFAIRLTKPWQLTRLHDIEQVAEENNLT